MEWKTLYVPKPLKQDVSSLTNHFAEVLAVFSIRIEENNTSRKIKSHTVVIIKRKWTVVTTSL